VTVNGQVVHAPSTLVAADAALAICKALPYVGRGGLKLAHALDRFGIDVTGRVCLDAGASTGGFTDVLLQRGAARVYALDVGKGLLAWSLRQDPRVVVMEEANVRYLRLAAGARAPRSLPGVRREGTAGALSGAPAGKGPELPEAVSLATVDVAFISLRLVLPAIAGVLTEQAQVVALVKPQFEAEQTAVKRGSGVVKDPEVHRRVLEEAMAWMRECGLWPAGLAASPIRGQAGNVEFLLWATRANAPPNGLDEPSAIESALAESPSATGSGRQAAVQAAVQAAGVLPKTTSSPRQAQSDAE
jgi:23S rRNA (cytidine1920-2'-O)/16S rRNA (cytidine1409-2'-O)-methyltransferase